MMSRARRTVTISVGSPTGNAAGLEFWSSRVPDLSQTIAAPRCALLWRAAMYMVVASFLFATMNALAKYVLITPAGAEIGALQVTFAAIFQGRFFCCRFCFGPRWCRGRVIRESMPCGPVLVPRASY